MEPFIIYLAKASGLTAIFFLAYTTFLKKETFFIQNRFFLLAGLFTSILLPFLVYTKIVWIEPQPQIPLHQVNLDSLMAVTAPAEPAPFIINWLYIAVLAYAAGVLFFLTHFIKDFYKVSQMLHREDAYVKDGFKYIDSYAVQSPFSFFKYIVYNSATLQPQELNDIIAHEKVHSSQRHSVDILVSQVFCIAFWFNPVSWLYKKAISQNLEFIADAEATKSISDKKAYQKTLLKITVQPECIAITNHFYQSLIKKRIVMLNKQQSKRRNYYKYALIVPALVAFVALFQVEVLAQEKQPQAAEIAIDTTKINNLRVIMDVTKDAKPGELETETSIFKQEFDADVTFTNIKRNAKGEITAIKVMVKDKDNQTSYPVYEVTSDDNSPIRPFVVDIQRDEKTGKNIINFEQKQEKIRITKWLKDSDDNDSISKEKYNFNKDKPDPKKVLYVIDGVPQKADSEMIKNLDPNEIEKIEVLKKEDDLIKLYGKKAKNGVIRITTKKKVSGFSTSSNKISITTFNKNVPAPPSATSSPVVFTTQPQSETRPVGERPLTTYTYSTTYTANNPDNIIENVINSSTVDYKKAYILINGKPATPEALEKVNPRKVNLSSVSIGNEKLISKYGDKAANGVITIDLKGYESETSKIVTAGAEKKVIDEENNIGYIIHRKTSKSDLKYYTKSLKDMGINAKISNVDRNKDGEITSIKIKLDDLKLGDDYTVSYANTNGIPSIYVGRKSGKAIAYAMK